MHAVKPATFPPKSFTELTIWLISAGSDEESVRCERKVKMTGPKILRAVTISLPLTGPS
jgi:hypothetical protein